MAEYALSNFHEGLRTLLGDEGDSAEGYDYTPAQLDGALRTAVRMGHVRCLALISGENPDKLTSEPPNPDTWGYLVAVSARMLIGAAPQESIRTRAMSFLIDPAARRDAVTFLDTMISDIDARGNLCGAAGETGHKGLFAAQGDFITHVAVGLPWCHPRPFSCQ